MNPSRIEKLTSPKAGFYQIILVYLSNPSEENIIRAIDVITELSFVIAVEKVVRPGHGIPVPDVIY